MINFNKIFGIGLNKTGTTSLATALNELGIPTLHYTALVKPEIDKERQKNRKLLSSFPEYRAFCDTPINKLYAELDTLYPDSKYIYTLRDLDGWLNSKEKHVLRNQKDPNYKGNWLTVDKDAWTEEWFSHRLEVETYFSNRQHDLLWFDIFIGNDWRTLCNFLEVPIPNIPFPKSNVATINLLQRSRPVRTLQSIRVRIKTIFGNFIR